jgi:hypothetical protein
MEERGWGELRWLFGLSEVERRSAVDVVTSMELDARVSFDRSMKH